MKQDNIKYFETLKARGFDIKPVEPFNNPIDNFVFNENKSSGVIGKITDLFKWLPKILKYMAVVIDVIKYIEQKINELKK